MQDTALPWLVLQLTHSPFHVGLLVFCRYGPFMVGGLYGGVIADRFDNRRVLICSQSLALCVAAALAAVAFTGTDELWLLYLLATGTGVALVFDNPSKHALIYQLMRPAELFPVERSERQTGLQALREGVGEVFRSPFLRAVLAMGGVLGLFGFSAIRTLLSVLADDTLNGGPRTFGVLFAAYGAGAVAGALAGAARARTGRWMLLGGALLFSTPVLALSAVHATVVAAALLFVAGAGWATWSSQAMAQVQLAAPDRVRGRVISLYTYTIIASAPLGGLLGGWLAGVGGTSLAFAVSGCAGVTATAAGAVALHDRRARSRRVAVEPPLFDETAV